MKITFEYKKESFTFDANSLTIDFQGRIVRVCYPIDIKSEWIVMFGKNHSPLFYMDDGTPVLARYNTRTGKDSYFQAFIDTETKQIVESLLISIRPGTYHSYTFQEVVSVRRPDKTLVIK